MPQSHLPTKFLERLSEILTPEDYLSCLPGFSDEVSTSFRVNTLKTTVPVVLKELAGLSISVENVSWCSEAFIVAPVQREQLIASSLFKEGRIYIQNLSSMIAPTLLDPKPGEEVLDLAAAPGGKTSMIAAMMNNQGRVAAVESVKGRFFKLRRNLDLQGVELVECYLKDGRSVGRKCPERFDRVLLDAPCSSESRFHLSKPESYSYWSEKKIKEAQRKQKQLLYSAMQSVKPGGLVLYSTCSFAPEENEEVVNQLLKKFPDQISIEPIALNLENFRQGLTGWRKKKYHSDLIGTVRVLPTSSMKGFYLAMLRKNSSTC